MAKEKINDATTKLNDLFKKNTFDDATHDALIYFTGNKNKLKYLLLAYTLEERHNKMLDHLEGQFGKINRHMISPFLSKELIWSSNQLNSAILFLSLLIASCITGFCIYLLWDGLVTLLLSIIIIPFAAFVHSMLDSITSSYIRTYFLTGEYKSLARPKRSL